jgi:signal transduction histidine kinase
VLPAAAVEEIGAAVDEALANVAEHAGTRRAWILVETGGSEVVVAVRDDGCGFHLDEAALRADGRLGLLGSIRGRVEDLGGRVTVDTAPGRGTEVEMHVPVPEVDRPAVGGRP